MFQAIPRPWDAWLRSFSPYGTTPRIALVASTLPGQHHELGVVMAAALAAERSWGTNSSSSRFRSRQKTATMPAMNSLKTLSLLFALTIASYAGEIRKGATMQVKPNSIWFQKVKELSHWQRIKKSGDSKALEAYQEKEMSERDAWQFTTQLTVKIVSYDAANHQVTVEMETPGRMAGTTWFLDDSTLVR